MKSLKIVAYFLLGYIWLFEDEGEFVDNKGFLRHCGGVVAKLRLTNTQIALPPIIPHCPRISCCVVMICMSG
jgi:hypothetical protein